MKLRKMMITCGVAAVTLALWPATALIPAYAADAEWADKLAADVSESSHLNIRESATTDSEIVGKLYLGHVATVIEKGAKWAKISSGSVEGFVSMDYCAFGDEAKALAAAAGSSTATVTGDAVRVRAEGNTESRIYTLLNKGDTLTVRAADSETDGWVPVEYNGNDAYICADYVDVDLNVEVAISIEEEEAEKKAKEEAEAKAKEEAESKAKEEAEAKEASEAEEAAKEENESSSEESADTDGATYLGHFKLTAYCPCSSCSDGYGTSTSSGKTAKSSHTVAMAGVPFGTKLLINGTVYTVEDRGTPYGHVDIYFDSHSETESFGLQYADVYQVN